MDNMAYTQSYDSVSIYLFMYTTFSVLGDNSMTIAIRQCNM